MRFQYQGLTASGETKQGTIDAIDQDAAVVKLQSKGIFTTNIQEATASGQDDALNQIVNYLPVKTAQKVFFFRQLGLMFRSGLSVTEGLTILTSVQKNRMRLIVTDLNDQINSGKSFSQSMERYEKIFSPLALHLIRSAEASGELEPALVRVAGFMERKAEVKKQLISTLTYPVVVFIMAIGVFFFLSAKVVPQFAGFFEKKGTTPPPEMLQMMWISDSINLYWPYMLVSVITLIGSIIYTYSRPGGRLLIDTYLLKVPLIGQMISANGMSQITWGLATLMQSGISVVRALQIISELVANKAISQDITLASEEILSGSDMGKSFQKPHLEDLVQQMTRVGETTGSMVSIMSDLGEFYEDRIKTVTTAIASAAEPMAILLIGGLVGYVYYAFFKSMFAVSGAG